MYKFKQYEINTNKSMNNEETRIITLSDLNWNNTTTKYDVNDLIVAINDLYPKYLFILGNIANYKYLQDKQLLNNLKYFFELLASITKTYIVFGKKDYEYENEKYTNIDNLISIYNNFKVSCINNSIISDTDVNIMGINLEPNKHYNNQEKKKKILELINKYNYNINNSILNILITHADISGLKNDLELINKFDLILSKSSYNIPKPSIFNIKRKEDKKDLLNNFIIENKGLYTKEEMDLIKIKRL